MLEQEGMEKGRDEQERQKSMRRKNGGGNCLADMNGKGEYAGAERRQRQERKTAEIGKEIVWVCLLWRVLEFKVQER